MKFLWKQIFSSWSSIDLSPIYLKIWSWTTGKLSLSIFWNVLGFFNAFKYTIAIFPVTSEFHNLLIQDLTCTVFKWLACCMQQPEIQELVLSPTIYVFWKENLSLKIAACKQGGYHSYYSEARESWLHRARAEKAASLPQLKEQPSSSLYVLKIFLWD